MHTELLIKRNINMTEREITLEAINSVFYELMNNLKRICVKEFGKPSDVIDKNGNPITVKRSWAQTELKEHSDSEFDEWLLKMNEFNYHRGYGAQELFGTIWLRNGLWMTRGEYDGSEWWDLHKRPPLPKK
jgi:hypothetical protein